MMISLKPTIFCGQHKSDDLSFDYILTYLGIFVTFENRKYAQMFYFEI